MNKQYILTKDQFFSFHIGQSLNRSWKTRHDFDQQVWWLHLIRRSYICAQTTVERISNNNTFSHSQMLFNQNVLTPRRVIWSTPVNKCKCSNLRYQKDDFLHQRGRKLSYEHYGKEMAQIRGFNQPSSNMYARKYYHGQQVPSSRLASITYSCFLLFVLLC